MTGLRGPGAVAVTGGRIVAAGSEVAGEAKLRLSFPDGLLLPGLVDLHAHADRGDSKFGVDPDRQMLPFGVTTVLSQGDAGAATLKRYQKETIEPCRTRVRLALNLAAPGETRPGPAFERLEDADVEGCAAAAAAPEVWGIAVNTSRASCGATDPRLVMERALAAAERCGKPLLVGLRRDTDWPLEAQLPLLRAADVATYCFSPGPDALVRDGRLRPEVWEARGRGVLFDLGHGMASFSFAIAGAAIGEGFLPDTISTDFYRRHVGAEPHHDLPTVLTKLLAVGMPEEEALARVTAIPAGILGLEGEIGTLAPGACADLAVLRWRDGDVVLHDTIGEGRVAAGRWEPVLTVRAGVVIGGETG